MIPTPSSRPLACQYDGPAALAPRVRYAVAELLCGLDLAPVWDAGGTPTLYVGPHPEASAAPVRIGQSAASLDVLAGRWPLGANETSHIETPLGPAPVVGEALPSGGSLPDVVASAFAWLSGLTEAAAPARDVHGRVPFEGSVVEALGVALAPPVDRYRALLAEALGRAGVGVRPRTWNGASWALALTHDVDLVRTRRLGALARGRLHRALARADPRWARLHALHAAATVRGTAATWFVKAGATGREDVAYDPAEPGLRAFWARVLADGGEVGLHPSYFAHDHADRLAAERDRLADAVGAAPRLVRTHYLRWSEPATPRTLATAGFALDGSLGFSTREGFRRGTAHPFRLYDLGADRPLDLWEAPLAVMDTALFAHRRLDPAAAFEAIRGVLAAARASFGVAVLLWHNEPLGPESDAVFECVVDEALTQGARVGPLGRLLSRWAG